MKILAIGDFHGHFPIELQMKIKNIKPDLIISPGDFCGNQELITLFFKHAYGKEKELWEEIGKKKTKRLELKNLDAGLKVLKTLNSFNTPIIAVTGNYEPAGQLDIGQKKSKWIWNNRDLFNPATKKFKSLKTIDFRKTNVNSLTLIGYPRSTYPGKIEKIKIDWDKFKKLLAEKIKTDYIKFYSELDRLFRGAEKPVVFISHNAPYGILDKISKKAHKAARGKHYGSYLAKEIIKKHQPLLCICGHMHENQGIKKLGKTTVVSTGAAKDGKAALIQLKGQKIKSIKFLK
jgi:Icc-related predicted phosphoesterase